MQPIIIMPLNNAYKSKNKKSPAIDYWMRIYEIFARGLELNESELIIK